MKKLLFALLLGLILPGCASKDPVTYTGFEAGTVSGGVFTTDNDVRMTIVGNQGKFDVSSARRVLISYETQALAGSDAMDIDVLGLWDAIIVPSEAADAVQEGTPDTPIQVTDAWFNAGYLNILASFKGTAPEKHPLTAACTAALEGITLRLYHDGTDDPSDQMMDIFASIPLQDAVTAYEHQFQAVGKKAVYPVPVLFQWTWYALNESGPVRQYEKKGNYAPAP